MMWNRLILVSVIAACIVDLMKTWRVAQAMPGPLSVRVIADAPSSELEGIVRYLYRELTVGNRLLAEIVLEIGDHGGESAQVASRLVADGFAVQDSSSEPALVLLIRADEAAAG
ncbi:MAG: hypothetical protein ACM3WU_07440 [Bacillota bacterium]